MMKRFYVFILILFFVQICYGANDLDSNPNRIDTFSADVEIHPSQVVIQNLTITAYISAKTITFIDSLGAVVLVLECPAGETISWPPAGNGPVTFNKGLYYDYTASELASGDFIFIFFK